MTGLPQRRLLIVDDDAATARALALTVRLLGYDADLAGGGPEAIRLARTRFYPIIVTDLRMPGMDGLSLIERLRPLCPATAFVILTGYAELDLRRSLAGDAVIASVVRKPWIEAELETTLTQAFALHQRRARRLQEGPAPSAPAVRLLLVEDNPADADLVIDDLAEEYAPAQVAHLRRLEPAIAWLHDMRGVEAVVTDLSLPDARGFDAVTRLHAASPGTPIVVLSGLADEDFGQLVIQLGAQDYLVKGQTTRDDLLRALRHARERKRGEQRLLALAQHDPLTGLANRAAFLDRLTVACTRARRGSRPFGVMFIDLDHFKEVNDRRGHETGDALLQEVGRRLEMTLREYDTAARLGGDEFGVLVEEVEGEGQLLDLGRRVLDAFAIPCHHCGEDTPISASIGLALFPAAGQTPAALLRAADEAMYHAKQAGRNRIHAATEGRSPARAAERLAIRSAVTDGDFELHFQPQVALPSGDVVGVEALLRWRRGDELLAPGQFLADLEASDDLAEVGRWVLAEACGRLAGWRRTASPALRLSLNLSARELHTPELLSAVRQQLAQHALPPEALAVELSERTLIAPAPEAHHQLLALRALGVRLTVDGFGSGHSSPADLVRYGVAALKIARPLTARLPTDPDAARVVRAMVGLGRSLEVDVLADGVETEAQHDFVRDAGCTLAQGYLFGSPRAEWAPDATQP